MNNKTRKGKELCVPWNDPLRSNIGQRNRRTTCYKTIIDLKGSIIGNYITVNIDKQGAIRWKLNTCLGS